MLKFAAKKLLIGIISTLFASVIIFLLLRILPGDTAAIIAGKDASFEQIQTLRSKFKLDTPYPEQYFDWITSFFKGDFANSAVDGGNIGPTIFQKSTITLLLCLLSIIFSLILALPLGIRSAFSKKTQTATENSAQFIGGVPIIVLAALMTLLFAKNTGVFGIFPAQSFISSKNIDIGILLSNLILPAFCIAAIAGIRIARVTKTEVRAVINSDFVRFSKSFGEKHPIFPRGLRVAATPILSISYLSVAEMLTGAVVVEKMFTIPGLGSMLLQDIANRDLIKIQSELLLLTIFIILLGTAVDFIAGIIDPRIRQNG